MIEAVLLYNPAAGRSELSARRLQRLCEKLYRNGIRSQPVMTSPHQRWASTLEGKQLLIVYGGDGTIHEAIREAVHWKVPVALLPGGTVNILARELSIPRNLERALEVIAGGKPRRIHLGKSGHDYFHLMAGVGLDAHLIRQLDPRLKRMFGTMSYWISGLISFWKYPMPRFEVDLDGETYPGTFVVIANARSYGGQLLITPHASVYEDCLDVCLFTGPRSRFFAYLLGSFQGKHIHYSDVIYRKAHCVRVSGDASIQVQMDGELVGHIPMEFASFPAGVEVVTPT